eukprot:TRINITY_DN3918_c0_g1_i2.p1 TRINITY_DN3918_c0_g1~~TRINITY_DN3918_c0_g1_i2.p1  ORF type:complete len:301 (-),score=62.18 TRINITY_DN3918_c0_g1_i2:932-1834(-)
MNNSNKDKLKRVIMYLQMNVIEARDLSGDPETLDAFVLGICGDVRFSTAIAPQTADPIWNEQFTLDMSSKKKKLILTVWDKDYVSNDIFLGHISLESGDIRPDGTPGWYPLEGRHGKNDQVSGEIRLSFVPGVKNAVETTENVLSKSEIKKSKNLVKSRVERAMLSGTLEVDLTSCELLDTPDELQRRLDWTSLDLGFNRYVSFPDLSMFEYLEKLWLTGNQIAEISPIIGTLPNLRFLYLNGNQLRTLPPEVGGLISLEYLDLSNNEILNLPAEIGLLTKLEELLIGGNSIRQCFFKML